MSLWSKHSARRAEKQHLKYQQGQQQRADWKAAQESSLERWLKEQFLRLPEGEWRSEWDLRKFAEGMPSDYSDGYYHWWKPENVDRTVSRVANEVGLIHDFEPPKPAKGSNGRWFTTSGKYWYCRWTKEGSPPESPAVEVTRQQAAAKEREKAKNAAAALRRTARERTHNHVRRSRELQAPGEHSTAEWLLKLDEFGHKCAYCGTEGADFHRDHLVPLVDGGSNAIGNIVPACPTCNLSKGGKSGAELLRWITSRAAAGRAA